MPPIDATSHQSPNQDARPAGVAIDCVVLHSCEGTPLGNEQRSSLPWLTNPASKVSCHYYITRAGQIYLLVPDAREAWHAGVSALPGSPERARYLAQRAAKQKITPVPSVNGRAIGIELEHHEGSAPYPAAQLRTLADLLLLLTDRHTAITRDRILTHGEVALPLNRKHDPTDWPVDQLHAWLATLPIAAPPRYTEHSPLLAPCPPQSFSTVTRAMLARIDPALSPDAPALGGYSANDLFRVILPAYWSLCARVGLDPLLAWAQTWHETGGLTSFWAQRPRRNPAGIGVNGDTEPGLTPAGDRTPQPGRDWAYNVQTGLWHAGLSFPTWADDAIPAHLGRLVGYACHPEAMTSAQRVLFLRATAVRPLPDAVLGSAPTLLQLGAAHNPSGDGWADPGTDYGARVAAIANALMR